jgi:hypothetical protein
MSPVLERHPATNASRSRAEQWLSAACSLSHGALHFGLALVVCASMSASAQDSLAKSDSTVRPQDGWIVGPSIGVIAAGGEVSPELFTIGLQFTSFSPGRLGADISVGTMPRALADGVVAFGFRADAAYPVSVFPHMLLLPAAGLSAVGVGGDGGGGGAMGINAGLAAVFYGRSSTGLRLGVTAHQFAMIETPIFLVEVGVVQVSGLKR